MAISQRTRKMLWGRSASRCSMPNCHTHLVRSSGATKEKALIGEEAHIVAQSPEGPRGDKDLTEEERDKYENLILLCRNCHREIDQKPQDFSVERLRNIKTEHKNWVRRNLDDYDPERQTDGELYAAWIDRIDRDAEFSDWEIWTSWILGGQPEIREDKFNELEELADWLFRRPWPNSHEPLRCSIQNFRRVLHDLLTIFEMFTKKVGTASDCLLRLKKFDYDPNMETNYSAATKTTYLISLCHDLTFELSRAGNFLIETTRSTILPEYRLEEGVLTVERGLLPDITYRKYRPSYSSPIESCDVYEGLKSFLENRSSRPVYFGEDYRPDLLGALRLSLDT